MNIESNFQSLDSLMEVINLNLTNIGSVLLGEKDIEALKWITTFYSSKINRIFESDLLYFYFEKGAPLELTIYEKDYKVERMVWVAESPLDVVAGITSRASIRVDIRDGDGKITHKENIKVYPIQGDMILFHYEDDYHLLAYDKIRYDRKDLFLNRMATAELYYMMESDKHVKEQEKIKGMEKESNENDLLWEEIEDELINSNKR